MIRYPVKPYIVRPRRNQKNGTFIFLMTCFLITVTILSVFSAYEMGRNDGTRAFSQGWAWTDHQGYIHVSGTGMAEGELVFSDLSSQLSE